MPDERPSAEQIDRWIAGTLSVDAAAEVERYFEEHPEALPGGEPSVHLLREAASLNASGDELNSLMDSLKGRDEITYEDLMRDSWQDLIEPTEKEGILGRLEQYEILELVANTGMATVLKARDPELDRLVAIKMLAPALATNATAKERFLREARAMATLEHDYILPIYDVHHGGSPWFVMRFIEGGSLQDALDKGDPRLQKAEFVEELAYEMATALKVAHRAGIIHRDLKPANILCEGPGGSMWLTDFGIARAIEDPGLTYGSTVAGTPRYMSPEQAAGETLDARSDLFSLGSVLYHVATGEPPFNGLTSTALLRQVAHVEVTPVGKVNPALPRWMSSLIDGLMRKDPGERPRDAGEILQIISARKVVKKTKRGIPRMVLVAALAVLMGLAGWLFLRQGQSGHNLDEGAAGEKSQGPEIQPEIISVRTGRRFPDFRTAVQSVHDSDTLQLRGEIVLNEPVIARPGAKVRLEGGESSSTVIRFRHRGKFGITFQGDASVSRIEFIAEERVDGFIALQMNKAQFLDLTYCAFEDRAGRGHSYAVHGHATQKIRLTGCTFRGEPLHGVFLCCEPKEGAFRGGDLHLEGCRFYSGAALALKAPSQKSTFKVRVSRCVVETSYFCLVSPVHDFRPTDFYVHDTVFNTQESLFAINEGTPAEVLEKLQWRGLHNIYTKEGDFLRFRDHPGEKITGLENFLNASAKISEQRSGASRLTRNKKGRIEGFFEEVGSTIRKTVDEMKE
jgi:tRNA A-37 threonylcarbamoyl transferase component Bud32